MSTKNLKRTPLEAGHYGGSRGHSRRNGQNHPNRNAIRAEERAAIKGFDAENLSTDEVYVAEHRGRTRHSDKLGAIKRWIESQCGRPWDKVFSEIAKRFDFQTMAGRHILTHIEGYIDRGYAHEKSHGHFSESFYPFYVDHNGTLQRNKNYRTSSQRTREYQSKYALDLVLTERIKAWQAGRTLGREGAVMFWYTVDRLDEIVWCEDLKCEKVPHGHVGFGNPLARQCPAFDPHDHKRRYRYHRRHRVRVVRQAKLSTKELAFYWELPNDKKPACTIVDGYVDTWRAPQRKLRKSPNVRSAK